MTRGWMRQGRSGVVTATVVVGAVAILLGLFVLGGAVGLSDAASTAPDQRYIEGSSLSSTESGGGEVFAATVVDPPSVDISTDEPTATAASQESVSSSPDPLPNLVANLSEAEGRLGEVVSVDLDVTSLGGTGGDEVGSYSFVLSYDSGVLAFDSVEGAAWSDPASVNDDGGTVAVADFNVTDQTPTEPALRFNFEIVGSGMSNITFDDDAPGIPAQNIINNGEAYTYAVQYESGGAGTGGEPLETTTVQRSPSFSSSDVASELPDVAVGDANTQNGVEISDAQDIARWLVGIDVSPFNEYVANATRETPSGGTGVQIGDAQRIADYVVDLSGVFVPDANITGFEPSETLTAGNSITESGVVKNDGGFGSIQEVYYRIADTQDFANVVYEKRLVIADLAPTGFDGNTTAFSLDIDPSLPAGDYAQRLVTEGIPPQPGNSINASVTTDLTIEPAGPDSASIVTQPGDTTAGESIGGVPEVSVVDQFGNEVPGVNVTVTASGPASLTDGSTTTVQTDAEGNATFDSLALETVGTYTLTFDAENVSGSLQTEAFNVSAAGADSVTVETQPTDTTAGEIIGGSPAANVTDAFGNAVDVDVTVSSVDAGTTTKTTGADGIATFDDLNITTAGTTTLTFDAAGVTESATTDPFEVTPAAVDSVEITPDTAQTVTAGEELSFSAEALDQFGNVNESEDSAFDWAGVTNISTAGLFNETSAAESGTNYDVTATIDGVSSAATTVTVEPAAVTNVTISLTSDQTVTAGETVAFSATASDQFGNVNESADSAFDWDASGGSIAGDGLFEETGAAESGSDYDVTATLGSVSSAATTVTVEPAAVDSVEITPASDQTVAAGEEIAFTATAFDQFGNVNESADSAFSWDASGGSIAGDGLFNQTSVPESGTSYDVTATLNTVSSAATTVTVNPAAVDTVTLSPASDQTVAAGEEIAFSATAEDAFGNVNESSDSAFDWDASGGSIASDGLFNQTSVPESGASYDVTATLDTVSSSATTVTVNPAAVDTVTISPDSDQTVAAGEEIAFSATATDQFGNVNESEDSAFNWAGVTNISTAGLFNETSAAESGSDYDVTATIDGVSSAATTVTVTPAAVESVTMSNSPAGQVTAADTVTMTAGEKLQFDATAYDRYGNVNESTESNFTWAPSSGGMGGDGLFAPTTAAEDGTDYDVTASLADVSSPVTTVTVTPAKVTGVTISPDTAQTVAAGEEIAFSATATDEFGNVNESDDSAFTWSGGSIAGDGLFNETSVPESGTSYDVTAKLDGVESSATTVTVNPAAVSRVEITPASDQTVAAGEEIAFSATAYDQFDNVVESDDSAFTWSGGSIAADGLFNETSVPENGASYDVTAELDGVTSATTTVTVNPAPVDSVEISPDTAQTISAGEEIAFSATATDRFGNVNESSDSAFTWDVSGGSIAGDGLFDETSADESGTDYGVTATFEGVSSAATTVTVEPAAVTSVSISPASGQTITAGGSVTFSATATDQFGNVNESDDSAFDWDGSGGSIAGDGLFDETGAGDYDVTATYSGVTSPATTVTVNPAAVDSVSISPTSTTVTAGVASAADFSAEAVDQYGNVITGTDSDFTWSASAGTVGGSGSYDAPTSAGTETVTADYNGVTASADVTVTPDSVSTVEISPTSTTVTAGVASAADFGATAKDQYGNVITSSDSDFTWSAGAGTVDGTGVYDAPTSAGSYSGEVTAEYNSVSSSADVTVNPASVSTVEISPTSTTVTAGVAGAADFGATAKDQYGNVITSSDGDFTWTAGAGSVDSSGVYDAPNSAGSYSGEVTAEYNSVSSSADVTVNPASVSTVEISPTSATVTAGIASAEDFGATAKDQYGNVITSSDGDFTWTASAGGVDSTGVYDAPTSAGSETVTAAYNGVSTDASVTVNPDSVSTVEISPTSTTVTAGVSSAADFGATAKDQYGNVITSSDGDFTWTASAGGVDSTGVYDAPTSAGSYSNEVTADYNGVTASADVTVNPASVSTVEISPTSTTVTAGVGGAADFGATAKDQYGNVITSSDGDFTWTASAGGVDNTGVYDAPTSAGSYSNEVTADYNGVTASADVTVNPASVSTVEIAPSSTTVTAGVAGAADFGATAKDQYGNVITSSDSDFTWTVGAGNVDSTGVYDAPTSAGSYSNEVTAEYNGVTASADVTVNPASVSSVEISPTSTTVTAGVSSAADFDATAKDQYGNVITSSDGDFSWTAGAGSVDSSGVYDAPNSAGSYSGEVTAEYSGVTSSADVTVNPASVSTVSISPTATTVTAGVAGATDFDATATDQYGNVITSSDSDFTWTAGTGSVDTSGVYDAPNSAGSYSGEVTASYSGVSSSADVTVNPASVSSVEISPTSATVTAGVAGAENFDATAKDQYGNVITSSDGDFSWSAGAGAVDGSGVYDAPNSAGSYSGEVTASYSGVSSSADVTVNPDSVSVVEISPTSTTVTAGIAGAADFDATAKDQYGNVITSSDGDFSWTAGQGSVDSTGVYDAPTSAGSYSSEVTASYSGVSASADVTVNPDSVSTVEISPTSTTVTAGVAGAADFDATAKDQYGNVITSSDGDFSWTAGAGSVDSTGVYDAPTSAGSYSGEVTATYNGVSTSADVTVEPASVSTVEISPTSTTVTAGVAGAADFGATAKDQYGNVITSSDGDFSWTAGAGAIDSTGVYDAPTSAGSYSGEVTAAYNGVSASADVTVTPDSVDSVAISPSSSQTVEADQTLEFSATAVDQYGNTITSNDGDFTWSGTDSTGTFQETTASTYSVSASYNGVSSTTVSVDVTPAPVDSVSINPNSAQTVDAGQTLGFSATATDQYGNVITSNAGDFSWSGTDSTGTFQETSVGTYSVSASYNDVSSTTVSVEVTPAGVDTVTISPNSAQTVDAGQTLEFSATAADQYGNTITSNDDEFSWSGTDSSGTFQETSASTYTVSVSYNGVSSTTVSVDVTPASVSTVTISPSSPTVEPSTSNAVDFSATAVDQYGNTITGTDSDFSWSATGGIVSGSGSYDSPSSSGTETVTAAYNGASADATVTVQAPANFAVTITTTNSPVVEGDTLNIDAFIENTGDVQGTQTIDLNAGSLGSDSQQITLGSGSSTTVTLSVGTSSGDAGSYNPTVSSDDDSSSTGVTINEPAKFTVQITNAPDVVEGEDMSVTAYITNDGGVSDTQTISMSSGLGSDSQQIMLGSGDNQFVTLSVGTSSGDAGSYNPTVSSDDDSASTDVQVNEPADFSVSFSSLPGTITQGENLDVSVQVSNNGGVSGSTDVTVNPGNLGNSKTTSSGSVSAGGSQTVSFTFGTTKNDGGRDYTVTASESATSGSASGSVTVDAPTIDFTVRLANDGDSKTGSTEVFVDETPNRYNPLFSQGVGVRTAGPAALYTGGASLADVTKTLLSGQENDSSEGETSPERDDGNRTSEDERNASNETLPPEVREERQEVRFDKDNVQQIGPREINNIDEPGVYSTDVSDYDYVRVIVEGAGGGGSDNQANQGITAGGGDGGYIRAVLDVGFEDSITMTQGYGGDRGNCYFTDGFFGGSWTCNGGSGASGYFDGGAGGTTGDEVAAGAGGGASVVDDGSVVMVIAGGGGGGAGLYDETGPLDGVASGGGGGGGGSAGSLCCAENSKDTGDDGTVSDGWYVGGDGGDAFGGTLGGHNADPGGAGGYDWTDYETESQNGINGGGGDGGGVNDGGDNGDISITYPDINIKSASASQSTIEPGDTISIDYTLENNEPVKGDEAEIKLFIDGNEEDDSSDGFVSSDGEKDGSLSFSGTNGYSDGDTINWEIKLEEFGDTASGTIDVSESPDISLQSVDGPNEIGPNDDLAVQYTLENNGGDGESGFIDLKVDGTDEAFDDTDNNVFVPGGGKTTKTLKLSSSEVSNFFSAGDSINWEVNRFSGGSISGSTTLDVPPDIEVTGISAPSSVNPGDDIDFQISLDNSGGSGSISIDIDFASDASPPGSPSEPFDETVSAGGSKTVTWTYSTSSSDAGTDITAGAGDSVSFPNPSSPTTTVSVNEPANFDVSITGTNSPVVEGDTLNVDVRIENTGTLQGTQNIDLSSSLGSDTISSLTLSGGQVTTRTMSVGTSGGDAGSYNPTVSSDDTSDSTSVQVDQEAFFDVSIQSVNSPVEGNSLDVTVNIDNTGDRSDTQTIDLTVSGLGSDSTGVFLNGGGSTTQTLSVGTGSGDAGSYTADVSSNDDSASQSVNVKAPANLQLVSLNFPNEIASGQTLNIDVTVENIGDVGGSDTIELVIGGTVEDSVAVSVAGGSQTTKTLSYDQTSSVVQALVDAGLLDITEETDEESDG